MKDDKANIESTIVEIIADMFPRTKDLLNKDSYSKPLTGGPICLEAFEMVYVFLEIEERIKVSFDNDDLHDYNFHTINRITELVCRKLSTGNPWHENAYDFYIAGGTV